MVKKGVLLSAKGLVLLAFLMSGSSGKQAYGKRHEAAVLLTSNEVSSAVSVPAVASESGSFMSRWADIEKTMTNAIVQVWVQSAEINLFAPYLAPQQKGGVGSGFFVEYHGERGYIITNFHVINQAVYIAIQIPALGKQRLEAHLVAFNPDRDLALLRLSPEAQLLIEKELGKIPALELGNSNPDHLRRADEIMVLGYPLGQQGLKSTTGAVSGRENMEGMPVIQIAAAINPGNSGGAAINAAGKVIGVPTFKLVRVDVESINYLIPSNDVQLFLDYVDTCAARNQKHVVCWQSKDDSAPKAYMIRRPFLGILFNPAHESLTTYLGNPLPGGLYVVQTYKASPMAKAGVQAGDMIYAINGNRLDGFGEMKAPWGDERLSIVDYVSHFKPGDPIELEVYRHGKKMMIRFLYDLAPLMPLRYKFPPYESLEYEIIGGMVIMELTLNHLKGIMQVIPELARYNDMRMQEEPVVFITDIFPDSAAMHSRALSKGMIVKEINGTRVTSIDSVRQAIKKSMQTGVVTIRSDEEVFTVLSFDTIMQQERRLSRMFFYDITPFTQDLLRVYEQYGKKA